MVTNVWITRLSKRFGIFILTTLFLSCGVNAIYEDSDDLSKDVQYKILDVEDAKSQLHSISSDLVKQYQGKTSATLNSRQIEMVYTYVSMLVYEYSSDNNKDLNFQNLRFYVIPTKDNSGKLIADITAHCFKNGDDWLDFSDHYTGKNDCSFTTSFPIISSGVIKSPPKLTPIEK